MSKLRVRVLLAGLVVGAIGFGAPIPGPNDPPLEDQPGWNCHIHGNMICGKEQ